MSGFMWLEGNRIALARDLLDIQGQAIACDETEDHSQTVVVVENGQWHPFVNPRLYLGRREDAVAFCASRVGKNTETFDAHGRRMT